MHGETWRSMCARYSAVTKPYLQFLTFRASLARELTPTIGCTCQGPSDSLPSIEVDKAHRGRGRRCRVLSAPGMNRSQMAMTSGLRVLTAAGAALVAAMTAAGAAYAQKSGGVLRVHALDSPPSLSMHEGG
jgi:hypothetical protein